jgi:hypothetical protein
MAVHPWRTHVRDVPELTKRYSDLGIPQDLARVESSWLYSTQTTTTNNTDNKNDTTVVVEYDPLPMNVSSHFHLLPKDICQEQDDDDEEEEDEEDEDEEEDSYFASVLLLSGDPMHGTKDEYCSYMPHRASLRDRVSFLMSKTKQRGCFLPSGLYSKTLDGGNPTVNDQDLIETAIRTTKSLCGLDLSKCKQWIKFCSFIYDDGSAGGKTTSVVFVPDIWNTVPSEMEYEKIKTEYTTQWSLGSSVGSAAVGESGNKTTKTTKTITGILKNSSSSSSSSSGPKDTLNVKQMKVSELRAALSKRSLSTKGIKDVLQKRLLDQLSVDEQQQQQPNPKTVDDALAPPPLPDSRCLFVLHPSKQVLNTYGQDLTHHASTLSYLLKQSNGKLVKERSSFETNVVARMFDEYLQHKFGNNIYNALVTNRNVEGGESDGTARYDVLSSLKYFDTNGQGCLDKNSVTRLIHFTGHGISSSIVNDLLSVFGKKGEYSNVWKN